MSENAPEISACDAMTDAIVARIGERRDRPLGSHPVERALDRRRVADQQRGLAEVVQQQAGQHERVPDERDRLAAEVAHVGVQRLAAGDDEEDAAEGEERLAGCCGEEVDDVDRVDRAAAPPGSRDDLAEPEERRAR